MAFLGLDAIQKGSERFAFGGSIPIEKALSSEVLLAYEMNGHPLPPLHGFPLRVLVPGYIGARSVKWLASIVLQDAPSTNYYQARAYKLFPPHMQAESVDWTQGQMLGALPPNSVIFRPCEGNCSRQGRFPFRATRSLGKVTPSNGLTCQVTEEQHGQTPRC